MDFGKDWANEKYTFGKEWDSEKMLQLYIYDHMKKRGLHDAADIFAKEANLEMLELVISEEGLLTEWWKVFWPQFCSRMTNIAEENQRSSAQPLMPNLLAMLATLKISGADRSEQPTGNPHQSGVPTTVINHQLANNQASDQMIGGGSSSVSVVGQSVLKTRSAISKWRAGKHPMNTSTASILGLSAAHLFEKGPLEYSPAQLLTTQITPVPPSGNASLQMPVTLLPPPQVAKRNDVSGERSVQVESTFSARQGSAYSPAAPKAVMEIKDNLLTEWWQAFWPIFCSSLLNKVIFCSSLLNKVKVKIMTKEKYMFHGNEKDAKDTLHLYIYHYMKKRELHEAAKIFAEEANIEMSELLDYDESMLKDWWDVLWPQFFSRMTKQPKGNPQSSTQPHVSNVVGPPPEVISLAPQEMSQRRAGKRPMNTDPIILGHSASKEKGKRPLMFQPVKFLPIQISSVPHSGNFSHLHLQMPGTIQPPPQVAARAYWPVQLESTYPTTCPPAALIVGESYRKNQGLLSGVGVNEPDGPAHKSRLPPEFLEFMKQAVEWEMKRQCSNSSLNKS